VFWKVIKVILISEQLHVCIWKNLWWLVFWYVTLHSCGYKFCNPYLSYWVSR